jgi:RNA polymerase sigma-70 factor, ECF subfamily
MVGDMELARDLAQDTFLSAYVAWSRDDIQNVRGWLYRIATNNALAHLRRKRLIGWIPLSRVGESSASRREKSPSEAVADSMSIRAALAALEPKDRACLLLAAAGFSPQEIAGELGCSHGAARTRLSRARQAFRRAREAEEAPEDE